MKFSIYQESREGARKINQDRVGYSYSRDALLMLVADGLGGHLHGEIAAQIVVQSLIESFQRAARPRLADPAAFLTRGMADAHLALVAYAAGRQLRDAPRTTCVACVVQNGAAQWAHVGDSRLYHLRGGRVRSRTRDHSQVQMLIDAGRLSEAGAARHPDRGKIFNCLGSGNLPRIELSGPASLKPGDSLLLCTDGLWGPLTNDVLASGLVQDELARAVPALLDQAQARAGGQCDNLSAVAMTWLDEPGDAAAEHTVELDRFTTQVDAAGKTQPGDVVPAELSDREIEMAIAEIRNALKKQYP